MMSLLHQLSVIALFCINQLYWDFWATLLALFAFFLNDKRVRVSVVFKTVTCKNVYTQSE